MAQDTSWLDAMSTPVQNGKALPDGSVVFNLPPNPADVAEQEREAAKEERAQAEKTFRTMTAEEAAAQGLPAGGVYQINGLGEIKTVREAPTAAETEKTTAQAGRAKKLQNLLGQLDRAEQLYREGIKGGLPNPISGRVLPFTEENSAFASASASAAQQAFSAFRVPGEGPQSDADLRLFVEANRPLPTDTEAAIEEKFRAVRARAISELEALGVSPPAAAQAPATREAAAGEAFLTERDKELQDKLSEAFSGGASLAELQAIAADYNQSIPVTQEELDRVRAAGGGIFVTPTGRDDSEAEYQAKVAAAADSFERRLGETGMLELAKEGITFGLSGEASGIGQAIGEALTGDLNVAENYAFGRDVQDELLRRARERTGMAGTAAEIIGGGGGVRLAGNAAFQAGRGLAASGQPVTRQAIQGRMVRNAALEGAGMGGLAGFGYGEGLEGSAANAAAGFALGGLAGAGGQALLNRAAPATRNAPEAVVPTQAPAASAAQAPAQVAEEVAALTPEMQAEVGEIARQAIGRGKTAKDAQAKLAIMAQVNPEAKAAAENLGMELPLDVLSDDARLLTVTGLARSQIGSEAQTAWGQTVSRAIEQSDDTLRAIGATRDLAQVSETIRARLLKDMGDLQEGANVLRREVNEAIDVQSRVDAQNLQAQLAKTINDLGGIDEAKQAFSAEERKLLAMLGEGEQAKMPTYARLNQLRDQIGRALFKNQGPWVDAPTATLERYYGALADDQIAHIEAVAGKDIADKMRGSNDLYSQMFKARESMKTVYGKSLEKDIGPLIKTAITSGSKGNAEALRKLMAAVPEDLRPQALLSGIFSLSERQSAGRGFSFAEYARLYSGLRQNSPIYAEIAKTIGLDSERILRDLYSISKRVAAAENKIVRTGASNQPLLNALNAEGLVSKLAAGAVRRGAVTGGTALAGGVAGGPVGAVVGGGIADALQQTATQAGKSNLDKLHGVLASEPFKDLVEKVATGAVKPADVNRVANDKSFRRFAATVLGIKDFAGRRNWLQSAMTAGAASMATPEQQPTSTIEVR